METRLKLWSGSLVVLAILAAALLLPPAPPGWLEGEGEGPERRPETAADVRADSLGDILVGASKGLAAWAIHDTVRAVLSGVSVGVADLVTPPPDGLAPDEARAYEAYLRARMDSAGAAAPKIPVVRLHLPAGFFDPGLGGRIQADWRIDPHVVLAPEGEAPYCAVVETHRDPAEAVRRYLDAVRGREPGDGDPGRVRRGDPVTLCRFHALYGRAGPELRSWLAERGLHLATDRADDPAAGDAGLRSERARLYRRYGLGPGRLPFGVSLLGTRESFEPERCVAGEVDACRAHFLEEPRRPWPPRSPGLGVPIPPNHRAWTWEAAFWGGFGGYESSFLADLEADFGEEAFRDFWTSDLGVADAFREAFGESLGHYAHRWAVRRVGPRRRGPGVPVASAALSLLFLAACAGAGAWAADRRRAG